jgi:aminomethyltransferase
MLKTTPFHARTSALCASHAWRRWAGYVVASSYELSHEREYHSIRAAAALFDVSPLYKYAVTGKDAARLLDHVVTRNVEAMEIGQVAYTPWCDARGKVLDDGTVSRLREQNFRLTAAEPNLRWLQDNAHGLDVTIEDVSESMVALSLQGPASRAILGDLDLKYFRLVETTLRGIPVTISRTGYTGDLGYELWTGKENALALWDALIHAGTPHGILPAGMLALDVARIEAGLLLVDVDFNGSRKSLIDAQRYSPYEMGLGRLVSDGKGPFVGRTPLRREKGAGPKRQVAGLEISWTEVEALYSRLGLPTQVPTTASRAPVPVYRGSRQVGKATSTTWSPVLKKLIALATIDAPSFAAGTRLEVEMTVEAVRHRVSADVVPTPFYNPPRKTAPLA